MMHQTNTPVAEEVDNPDYRGRDFREVATLAGLDPEGVAERCKEILSCPEKAKTAYQSLVRISDDEE